MSSVRPLVSVVVPVYNGARYLGLAIDSVLAQSFQDFELLVIDDGSSDESAEIASRYSDPRVRLLRNEVNRGLPFTRNRGIAESKGEFIAFLDSDDEAMPNRLELQFKFLQTHPELAGVGASAQPIDGHGSVRGADWICPGDAAYVKAILLFKAYVNTSTFFARRKVLEALRFDDGIPLAEDYDLYIRLTEKHLLVNMPETLVRCRIHGSNITRTKREQLQASQVEINRRQLEKLGLKPSQDSLLLHRQVESMSDRPTPELLERMSDWLAQVLRANQTSCVYEPGSLRQAVGERWHAACESALRGGARWAWFKYYGSKPVPGYRLSFKEHFKLAARLIVPNRAAAK